MKKKHRGFLRTLMATVLMLILVMSTAWFDDGKSYALGGMAAPTLTKLEYYRSANGTYNADISWKSKKGATYQILRRQEGTSWKIIGQKKAKSKKCTYTNSRISGNATYIYSVRQIKKGSAGHFDTEGLRTLTMPEVKVDYKTLNARITWNKVEGATKYLIYRKIGKSDKYHLLATVSAKSTAYTDVYRKSYKNKKMKALFTSTYFVDPSNNPIIYTVRPYYSKKTGVKSAKQSYGMYLRDGVCHLEPPTIVSLSYKGVLKWGTVPNASGYAIYTKNGEAGKWKQLRRVPSAKKPGVYQTATIKLGGRNTYYAVRAYAYRNATTEYSDYDTNFTRKNVTAGKGKRVLFLGDSMTFGSPYYGASRNSFSYANRIKQLTGISMFNPSIPGSTWRYHPEHNRHRIVTGVANMIAIGQNTDYAFQTLHIGKNTSKFEDYDIVVLAAGTNDYQDKTHTPLGTREPDWEKIKAKDKTRGISFTLNGGTKYKKTYKNMNYDYNIKTFNGAYNQILKYIEEASIVRVMNGKAPIKVVPISLFYSDRTYPYNKVTNRNVTKNAYGYTLRDYQRQMDKLNAEWDKSPALDFYCYDSQAAGIVNSSNCGRLSSDNLHYSKYTYGLYGDDIAQFMIDNKVFASTSAAKIKEIRESKDFRTRLKKYSKYTEFKNRLGSKQKTLMKELLAMKDPAPEKKPETADDNGTGSNASNSPSADTPAAENPAPDTQAADNTAGGETAKSEDAGNTGTGSNAANIPSTDTPAAENPAPDTQAADSTTDSETAKPEDAGNTGN